MTDDLLPIGSTIGRYTIEGLLGQGGMAAVYKVRHEQLNTLHALKMLTVPGRRIRQRLVQEGRVQAALRHPNIVAVIDIIEHENQPGLVMEYVDGPTLEQLLAARKLAWHEVDHLGRGIIRGVQAAHDQGLIHRDLKPANVLIAVQDDQLVPKVTDFGLAKLQRNQTSGHTRSGDTMGTPAYMAPEAIKNAKHVDHRADVFSLGALLHELITGERCFQGADILETFTAVVNADHVPLPDLRPDVPMRMIRAIEGALHPEPDERLQDVRSLLQAWIDAPGLDPGTTLTPVYTPELLNRVKAMGQGQDSLSKILSERETLPITSQGDAWSLRSLGSVPDTTETYMPADETQVRPRDPSDVPDPVHAAPTQLDLLEDPAPAAPRAGPPPEPEPRFPWVGVGLAALGVATLLVGIGALSAAGVVVVGTVGDDDPVVALPTAPVPEPQLIPELADLPEPPVPEPTPAPAPEVSPPTPPPPAPEPVPQPPPVPVAEPVPAPVPVPVSVPADAARVAVTGGIRVQLKPHGDPGLLDPGPVPPGTYTVVAWFSDEPTEVMTKTLAAGDDVTVRCMKEFLTCK